LQGVPGIHADQCCGRRLGQIRIQSLGVCQGLPGVRLLAVLGARQVATEVARVGLARSVGRFQS